VAGNRRDVSLIIAGTVRIPPENLERFRPHMLAMMAASQAEDGCNEYAYALDIADPGLIRIFESWESRAHLDAHFKTDHMVRWRETWPGFGLSDRTLIAYEVAAQKHL
jgi:quinol monooxygenase YgiN